jgi:comEA protein
MLQCARAAKLSILILLCNLAFTTPALYASKKPPIAPVNINSASAAELQQVPGIGPSTAEKILQMRKSYGAFKSVNDLLAIRGIGKKRLDKMRKYLTAGKSATKNNTGPLKNGGAKSTASPPPAAQHN